MTTKADLEEAMRLVSINVDLLPQEKALILNCLADVGVFSKERVFGNNIL